MKHAILVVCLMALPLQAFAEEWNCRNEEMEIRCDRRRCDVERDRFTPASISFDSRRRTLEACAYSGCWNGKARIVADGPHLLVSGRSLAWSQPGGEKSDFMFALDTRDGVGVLKGEGFAMPLHCKAGH